MIRARLRILENGWLILIVLFYSYMSYPLFGMISSSSNDIDSLSCSVVHRNAEILLPYGSKDYLYSVECDSHLLETAFFTNVNVNASTTYPALPESNPFSRYVNQTLEKDAFELFNAFVKEMSFPDEDHCEEDADERVFHYELNLVYSSPNLMSFYGSYYQYRGGAHGAVKYLTKNFVMQDETIRELTLDDLFLPGFREQLFQYCENYFKSNRCGYYKYDDYSCVGFSPKDIEVFLLNEKGLLLIFQNYIIDGCDDYPVSLLIPYSELSSVQFLTNKIAL